MHPILTSLHWHGVTRAIGSYGVMLTLALWVGAALALWRGKQLGLEAGALISSFGIAVASGFVGAFLCSVGVRLVQLGSLREALAAPGIVFFGALGGGALGLWAGTRWLGLPWRILFDATIPALPVAHALGRVVLHPQLAEEEREAEQVVERPEAAQHPRAVLLGRGAHLGAGDRGGREGGHPVPPVSATAVSATSGSTGRPTTLERTMSASRLLAAWSRSRSPHSPWERQ